MKRDIDISFIFAISFCVLSAYFTDTLWNKLFAIREKYYGNFCHFLQRL